MEMREIVMTTLEIDQAVKESVDIGHERLALRSVPRTRGERMIVTATDIRTTVGVYSYRTGDFQQSEHEDRVLEQPMGVGIA